MSDAMPDLRTYIDQVIDEGVTDVADVAAKVRAIVPPEVMEAYALHFLRLAVRARMSDRSARNPVLRGAPALRELPPSGTPRAVGAPISAKRQRQRDQWAAARERWLADTFATGPGSTRIRLGDATAADLIAAARYRREQAKELSAQAVRFEEIAAEVAKLGDGAKVADLPELVLRRLAERP